AASSEEKLEVARNAGADELVNYSEGDFKEKIKALTDGKGADVIYDPVGGDLFDQCMRCINWKGRLLVVGFASGRIPELPGNLANFRQLFKWYSEGKLKPLVSQTFALDQYEAALTTLTSRQAVGKIVINTR